MLFKWKTVSGTLGEGQGGRKGGEMMLCYQEGVDTK